MLRLFDTNVAIPFFPAGWANAVTNWLTGLFSPNGTIRIKNTANPTEGGGCAIDVDVENLYRLLRDRLQQDFVTRGNLASEMRGIIGQSMNINNGLLNVNDGYLAENHNSQSQSI